MRPLTSRQSTLSDATSHNKITALCIHRHHVHSDTYHMNHHTMELKTERGAGQLAKTIPFGLFRCESSAALKLNPAVSIMD